jgi:hypothetical protein
VKQLGADRQVHEHIAYLAERSQNNEFFQRDSEALLRGSPRTGRSAPLPRWPALGVWGRR